MRVSIDIDASELRSMCAFFNMRYRYAQVPRIFRTSRGGFRAIAYGLPLSWQEANQERRLFNDDEGRVYLDIACRGKPSQLLFSTKATRTWRGESFEIDERSLLALPQWVSRWARKR